MIIHFKEKIRNGKWRKGRYIDTEKIYGCYNVDGGSEAQCFEKIYTGYERSLRYCNGYYIELDDPEQHQRYLEWKQHGVTIEMFYGSNVYD